MQLDFEKCPLCGTGLSVIKLKEIEAKLQEEERAKATEIRAARQSVRLEFEQKFKLDLEKEKLAVEKRMRDETRDQVQKVTGERDLAAKKLKESEVREAQFRRQAQVDMAKEKLAIEQRAKAETEERIKKEIVEREKLQQKLKDAEQREALIKKRAEEDLLKQKAAIEKKAKEQSDVEIKKITLERDQAAKKIKDFETKEISIRKQSAEQAEKLRTKELGEQREALEKDKNSAISKLQSQFNRDRESLQKQVSLLERKVQSKTANELGDAGEIDVYELLRESFRDDRISRIKKGQPGADIVHEIIYKGEVCGKIVIDAKNRKAWQHDYVTKLRKDRVEAQADHAILATNVFPAGKKEMCIESGIIVMAPARIIYVIEILRRAMIAMHIKGLSIKERTTKMSRLYELITSESYAGKITEANKLTQDILDLEVQEQTEHTKVWRKRGSLLKRVQNVLRETETEVAAIIEAGDHQNVPAAFGVRSMRPMEITASSEEVL